MDLKWSALLVRPLFYEIKCPRNEFMKGKVVDREKAMVQWEAIRSTLTRLGVKVEVMDQVDGLPDMVFACNSGLAKGNYVRLGHLRYPERQAERAAYEPWFKKHGYNVTGGETAYFEGGGDAWFSGSDKLLAGVGTRTELAAYTDIKEMLGLEGSSCKVVPLELVHPTLYHMDVCMLPVDHQTALYFPDAFSKESQVTLSNEIANLIPVSETEAMNFACNGVSVPWKKTVMLPLGCPEAKKALEDLGWGVVELDISEFMKSGGGIQCCTMKLFE